MYGDGLPSNVVPGGPSHVYSVAPATAGILRFAVVPGHAFPGIPANGIITFCDGGTVLMWPNVTGMVDKHAFASLTYTTVVPSGRFPMVACEGSLKKFTKSAVKS
ncbi:MAG: hypothetical protein BWX95_01943 [Bacteroidetes bacterium ADurb.Bin141]|nr:MAG: hypothetical protein BWX95_01943 [Bacteroidetes bacterium ADurb.Bin141]